jgi:hypothetical protein
MRHPGLHRSRVALAAGALLLLALLPCARLSAQSADTIGPVTSFMRELRLSSSFRTAVGIAPAVGTRLEFLNYSTPRLHDHQRQNMIAEEIAGPLTFIHLTAFYQPNRDFALENEGAGFSAEAIKTIGGPFGIGGIGSYNRTPLDSIGSVIDFEIGPELAYWTSERTYLTTSVAYRRVVRVHIPVDTLDDYIQIRNHLTYVPSEDWSFSYSQDVGIRVGLRDTPHTNALDIINTFLFSPSARFSWGVKAGVALSYFVRNETSLITIPIGFRAELFPTLSAVVTADVLYELPTMIRQRTGGTSVTGGVGFRF